MEDILARYRSNFSAIPGWFTPESMFIWDFLLRAQDRLGVAGDFFEIGVFKGKSAVLGALYLRPEDWCILMDCDPFPEASASVESIHPGRNRWMCRSSIGAGEVAEVRNHFGKCRWVHIDGDHKGLTVTNDLKIGAELIHENGIICLDDFFSFRYPQLTAATYKFLFNTAPEFQLFFAGSNKGYICRASAFPAYDRIIRENLVSAMDKAGIPDQLNRTSYASDYGCFTISWREGERRVIGVDENPEFIPD